MIKKVLSLCFSHFFKAKPTAEIIQKISNQSGVSLDISRIRIKDNQIKLIINQQLISPDQETTLIETLKNTFPKYHFLSIHEHQNNVAQIQAAKKAAKKPIPHAPTGSIRPSGMKKILIVASGKGGVGKSAVSLNLARCLKAKNLKVALIDCDIYGPSSPVMTGGYEKANYKDSKLQPIIRDGIKTMSMGYMIDPAKAVIWRGPMVSGAIGQMFQETDWGEIDVAIVDMPPGTGDAQLTICQNLAPDGVIIVSQPQMVSIIDAERCGTMFEQLKIPIWGVIENMSGFVAPDTGKTYYIFGQGGAENFAKAKNYPYLGALPIVPMMAYASDQGLNPLEHHDCKPFMDPLMDITTKLMHEKINISLPQC